MAPLIRLLLEILPSVQSFKLPSLPTLSTEMDTADVQQHSGCGRNSVTNTGADLGYGLSAVSWGPQRVDVFGKIDEHIAHNWRPDNTELEKLGSPILTSPTSTSWGVRRLDIFALDQDANLVHQFWDGSGWQPSYDRVEALGAGCSLSAGSAVAATTWGPNRLDAFCRLDSGNVAHAYWDGTAWQPPKGGFEDLGGGDIVSGPAAVSWGENRLDIFGVTAESKLVHQYWDGTRWLPEWEVIAQDSPVDISVPMMATSWGQNRIDIWANSDHMDLLQLYWDGSQWSEWESLGGTLACNPVAVSHWSANRTDIVALGLDAAYYYKYWDGSTWQPSADDWYNKGGKFMAGSAVASWGPNRLDIFGLADESGDLLHQAWTGGDWYPKADGWEALGSVSSSDAIDKDMEPEPQTLLSDELKV